MAVYHRLPDDPAKEYFSTVSASDHEDRKKTVKGGWDGQPDFIKDAYLKQWEAETEAEAVVSGLDGLQAIQTFLKTEAKRTNPTEVARLAEVREILSGKIATLKKVSEPSRKFAKKKVDTITAVKEILGISYQNLSSWFVERDDKGAVVRDDEENPIPLAGYEALHAELVSRIGGSADDEGEDTEEEAVEAA